MAGPQQYGTAPPPYGGPAATPPAPNKMRRRRIVALIVFVVVVVGIVLAALVSNRGNPDSAKVNDCVTKPENNSIKVVDCSKSTAAYRVAGKVENKTQVDVSLNSAEICKPFPTATSAYWKGKIGKPGYVLCLAPKK